VQLVLVACLDAALADQVRAAVVGVDAFLLEPRLVLLVDAPHVAQHVRGELAERVLAEQAGLDLDPLEAEAVGREPRGFLVGEAAADRQAFGVARFLEQLLEARPVARRNFDELGHLVDGALDAAHAARVDFQRVAGNIPREHRAVAVHDQAEA
jgi:hypothetical protein